MWDDDEQRVLRTGAELFGQVIQRWEAEDALREQVALEARAETLSRVNAELTQALRLKDES